VLNGEGAPREIHNPVQLGGAISVGGQNLTLTDTGLTTSTPVTLAASTTLTVATGVELDIAKSITDGSSTFALVKAGSGTLTLGSSNSYTGITTINAGTLVVSALSVQTATPGTSTDSLGNGGNQASKVVIDGGVLQYVGVGGTTDRNVTIGTSGGTLDASGTGALVMNSTAAIGGSGARNLVLNGSSSAINQLAAQLTLSTGTLTKSGPGTWSLTSATSNYTGVTSITDGVLEVTKLANGGSASSIGSSTAGSGNLVISTGATLRYVGSGDTSNRAFTVGLGGGGIASSGTGLLNIGGGVAATLSGTDAARTFILSGTNTADNVMNFTLGNNGTGVTSLRKDGVGTWVMPLVSAYTGVTNVAGGRLKIGISSAINSNTNMVVSPALAAGSSFLDLQTFSLAVSALTMGGAASGTASVVGTGAAVLTLGGGVTYSATGAPGQASISVPSLDLGASSRTFTVGDSANAAVDLTVSSVISGAGGVTKAGSGVLELSGVNTFTGALTIDAASASNLGIIIASANNALGTGPSTVRFNSNALGVQVQLVGGITLGNSGFTTSGAGLAGTVDGLFRSVSGNNTITGPVTLTGGGGSSTFRSDAGATLTFSGNIGADTNTVRFINVVGDGNFAFGGVIAQTLTTGGSTGLWSMNSGVTRITGVANTYALVTAVGNGGTLEASLFANGGTVSSIGTAAVAATNLILDNGTLRYVGTGAQSTNRLFSVGNGGGSLEASGATASDTLSFTGTGSLGFSGVTGLGTSAIEPGARTLTLAGANSGNNRLSLALIDQAADTGVTSLTKTGSGRWILDGTNTYTGVTNVSNGVLNIQSVAALGSTSAGTVVASGATLQVQVSGVASEAFSIAGAGAAGQTGALVNTLSGTNNFGAPVSLAANAMISSDAGTFTISNASGISGSGFSLTLAGAADGSVTGAIGIGSGGLIKSGAGNWTLSAASAYDGVTSVNAGILTISNAGALGSSAAGTSVASGAELRLTGGIAVTGEAVTLNGQGVSSSGALRNFAGSNTVASAITLASASRINSDAGTLVLSGGVSSTNLGLTLGGAGNVTISTTGLSLGTGALIKDGSGILTLSLANTFSGGTTINGGELIISNTGALGSGAVTIAAGAILDLGGLSISNAITATPDRIRNGPTTAGVPTSGATAEVNTVLTGTGGLAKSDGGTLSLNTPNFFTGAVTANTAGAVIKAAFLADNSSSLGAGDLTDPTKLQLGAGAALEFTGTSNAVSSRSFTLTDSAGIAAGAGAGTLTFTADAKIDLVGNDPQLKLTANNTGTNIFRASLTDADILAGNGIKNLTVDGTGTWILGGASNRFKGDVRVDAGAGTTIGLENGALPTGATVGVDQGSTLRWETGNTAPVKLSLAAGVSAKLDLGTNDIVFTNAPAVVGTGSVTLEKQGTGAMRIADNLSAPTVNMTVSGGLLSIGAGSTLGNITLASGARLGGKGTVGVANVGNGAFLAPGNSPGTLNATTLILGPGSNFDWEVQNTGDNINGYDRINLTGNLDLRGVAPGQKVNFRIFSRLGSGDGNQSGNPLNFDPPGGASTIKTFAFGTVGGLQLNAGTTNISDVFTFDLSQFTYSDGSSSNAGLWSIDYNAGIVTLTAVPEPSTYGFGLGALALAAAAIRRRKRQATKA
jgi:fibronectin-binding autotransporter adhesin